MALSIDSVFILMTAFIVATGMSLSWLWQRNAHLAAADPADDVPEDIQGR